MEFLYEFAESVLLGELQRPRHSGKQKLDYKYRDQGICYLVNGLLDKGFSATRNDATEHRNSACDLVAEAMRSANRKPDTYGQVKRIWLKGRGAF